MSNLGTPIPVEYPSDTYPDVGEYYRFFYRFSGGENIGAKWPGAVERQVQNGYAFNVYSSLFVDENRTVVVDVAVVSVPSDNNFADLESMLASYRQFTMSATTVADLVGIESIPPTLLGNADSMREDVALDTRTVWGGPAPETISEPSPPGILESAVQALGDSVRELFTGAGSLVGDTVGAAVKPNLLPILLIGGVALAIILYTRKGG